MMAENCTRLLEYEIGLYSLAVRKLMPSILAVELMLRENALLFFSDSL